MGWTYYAATKKALIADRTAVWDADGVRGTTLAFCVRRNRLWVECEKWREGVHAYHARIHRRVEIGQRLHSGSRLSWVRIVSIRPLRGEYRGSVYRLPRMLLGEVLPESVP